MTKTAKIIFAGILSAAAFTAIIALTALNLEARHAIVGVKLSSFFYPWQLKNPSVTANIIVWTLYVIHNLIAWGIIWFAQRERPKYSADLRWFNWAFIATNVVFIVLHIVQTQLWYDGLAATVPEITSFGSVALMLMFIIIFETPRRGLIFGNKFKFRSGFIQITKKYHGYLFAWATIYTFWYHPTEGTWGHLMGFMYMFMLLAQSTLIFNRAHVNKYWTFLLEFFVLIHGVMVAIFQGTGLWPMFAFGFGSMVVLTQMYGLGLNAWTKRLLAAGFVIAVVAYYGLTGHFAGLNEVIRIPVLDYMVIFLLYGLYLLINWIVDRFKKSTSFEVAIEQ